MNSASAVQSVLIVTPHFEPATNAGGVARSVTGIVDSLPLDIAATVITSDRDLGDSHGFPNLSGRVIARGNARVIYCRPWSMGSVVRALRAFLVRSDLLYINSLWHPKFGLLPILLFRLGVIRARVLLLAPRGQLSPAALSIKRRQKRRLIRTLRWAVKRGKVLLHASSVDEQRQCDIHFPDTPNIVSLDPVTLPMKAAAAHSSTQNVMHLVFASRIAPIKNLLVLLESLRYVSRPVRLSIAGPIEDLGYWGKCEAALKQLPANVDTAVLGALSHPKMLTLFRSADLFVLPTRSENFGHVIAESLSQSCPVFCGPDTPWGPVLSRGGGKVINPESASAVGDLIQEHANLGSRGWRQSSYMAGRAYEAWRRTRDNSNVVVAAIEAAASGRIDG